MVKKKQLEVELAYLRGRFEALFAHSPDLNYFIDTSGQVFEISSAAGPILRFTAEQLQQMSYLDLVYEQDRELVEQRFASVLSGEVQRFETRLIDVDGVPIEFEILAIPVQEGGELVGAFGVARDISRRKDVERQLLASEQRYRALFDDNVDAVLTYDTEGRFVAINHATEVMMGYDADELIGQPFLPYIVPAMREYTIEQFMSVKQGDPVQYETAMFNRAGEVVDLHITVIPIMVDGEMQGIHCVGKDITKRKQLEAALNDMAYHDYLTGLPNQRSMNRHLAELMAAHLPFALYMLDLDRFKSVNDSWGHETGDLLLKSVTKRLAARIPQNARLFRYGGDEMVAVLQSAEESEVMRFAEQLQELFEESFVIKDHEVVASASIGIATFPEDGDLIDTIFRKADNAMYFAKQHGRNTHAVYRAIAREGEEQLLQLEIELRGALRAGEMSVRYQPQVNLKTGALHGIEALLRWDSPRLGPITPEDFIPIAEESGIIVELGTWVLDTACAQLADWRERGLGRLKVSVNVSIHQFYHDDFLVTLRRTLEKYAVDPTQLVLEITESIASNADLVVTQLIELKKIGVEVAIDDFGTGYSSLQYLKNYPIDYMKIDRTFLEEMETSQADRDLIATIITLAHNLGLQTVAEGAETEAHIEFLRAHESEFAQGFYFSGPLTAAQFERWIAER
ncbi:putative bifunctional diguanylate cyclase/phosphodiesterase [Leucobacter sp. W1153]|uniref:putative bifunctional diguanylate cyclase/phosphodiesterase n=1 Tax=Leucobacter sp. W1153 TaxID=3439064 RepID=UPI003F39B9B0